MTTLGILFLLGAGVFLRRTRPAIAVAAAALFLWAWPPFEVLFSGTLEWQFPIAPFPAGDADAIVVLSASVYPRDASQPEALPGYGTYLRCRRAAWLFQHWKAIPIVVSGGPAGGPEPVVFADVMARELENEGVPAASIWRERESGTTYENALYTAQLLQAKGIHRIVLVTEAYHMPRAARAFRHQALDVLPAPCAYRTARFHLTSWRQLLPSAAALVDNEENLHEWIGLLWYSISGKA